MFHSLLFVLLINTGDLKGIVVDQKTKLPLSAVTATLIGETGMPFKTSITGAYAFSGLASGKHQIKFEKWGYQPTTRGFEIKDSQKTSLEVGMLPIPPFKGPFDRKNGRP